MTLEQLIKELEELKENGVTDAHINDIKNLLIDYGNETQDRSLDDYINTFVSDEDICESIRYRASRGDWQQAKFIIEDLESADYYRDNGDYFENINDEDVEDRLDDIISHAEDLLSNQKKEDAGA